MECETKIGNPHPKFKWIFDNQTQVPENWHHENSNFATTTSTLQYVFNNIIQG